MIVCEGRRIWKAEHLCVSSNDTFTSYRLSGTLWPNSPFAASHLDLCRTGLTLGGLRENDRRYEPLYLSFQCPTVFIPRVSSFWSRGMSLRKGSDWALATSVPALCSGAVRMPRFRNPVRALSCLVDRWTRTPFHVSRRRRGAQAHFRRHARSTENPFQYRTDISDPELRSGDPFR